MTSLLLRKHAEPPLGSRLGCNSQTPSVSGNVVPKMVLFPMGITLKKRTKAIKKKRFVSYMQDPLGVCINPSDTSLLGLYDLLLLMVLPQMQS